MRSELGFASIVLGLLAAADSARGAGPIVLESGLDPAARARFYHTAMGSEIMPLAWLRALESRQTGKPFLEGLDRFGFLGDPDDPDGLPIGLTAAEPLAGPPGKVVGLNCAACHVGTLTYRGKSVRIDGAPNLIDVVAFSADLGASAAETLGTPSRLAGFLHRLIEDPEHKGRLAADRPEGLRLLRELGAADRDGERSRLARLIGPIVRAGSGAEKAAEGLVGRLRTDLASGFEAASGDLRSLAEATPAERAAMVKQASEHVVEVVQLLRGRVALMREQGTLQANLGTPGGPGRVDDFGLARNLIFGPATARPANGPSSIPPLWAIAQIRWQGWDGNSDSALQRNIATALASGASFDRTSFASTVLPRNLGALETLSNTIKPPRWPADIFGPIDRETVARGAALFREHCQRCHVPGDGPPPDLLFAPEEVGTDPNRARNFAIPLGDRPLSDAIAETLGHYTRRALEQHRIDHDEARALAAGRPDRWRTTGKYVARPLVAIWATPPYLHNGSVPTLDDLLLPASQRPKTFVLGAREYDPSRVGYVSRDDGNAFRFDTTLDGNHNTGHEYGTGLSAEDRKALLEYLKGT
jgi:mono/diheme cytochrome c family protein